MPDEARRVVLTGIGPVTPIGIGVARFWDGLVSARSGAGKIEAFDASGYACTIAAEVHDFRPEDFMEAPATRRMERFAQFAVAGAALALEDAGLSPEALDPERTAVVAGTGIGGIASFEREAAVLRDRGPGRVGPSLVALMIPNMAGAQIAMRFGITGPNDCTVTACAASGHAVARAMDLLRGGRADVCLAGGAEAALTPLTLASFCSARALSTRNHDPAGASRPFDLSRDGFVLGEGATILTLETWEHARARGARVIAEIAGYGMTADAHHVTAPEPTGKHAATAMRLALADAGMEPDEIGYVNAHGTSTRLGDVAETRALHTVFGSHARRLAVSSTKSMTGHLLGAAGSTELAACALAVAHGVVPPTINYSEPDPECDLDYVPNRPRWIPVGGALSNSFGFGGQNVSLVVRRVS